MAGEIITDAGLNQLAKLFSGQDTAAFAYIALGTGTNGPTADDTELENEVLRKAATVTVEGNKVTFEITINPGELIATNVTEVGLFNDAAAGVMYYRKVRDQGLYFDTDIGANVSIEITFSGGGS